MYLDVEFNEATAWNVARGVFGSPSLLPGRDERQQSLSFAATAWLQEHQVERLKSELRLNVFRKRYFPEKCSRLTSFFIFENNNEALSVLGRNAWNGRHFQSDNLSEVGIAEVSSSRHDADWIEKIITSSGSLWPDWEDAAKKYWAGEAASVHPTWEKLVEGFVTVWNYGLRRKSVEKIFKLFPDSSALLEYSANCALMGSGDGLMVPIFVVKDAVTMEVGYYLRLRDALDGDFMLRYEAFINQNSSVARFPRFSIELKVPDLTIYTFSRNLAPEIIYMMGEL